MDWSFPPYPRPFIDPPATYMYCCRAALFSLLDWMLFFSLPRRSLLYIVEGLAFGLMLCVGER